MDIGGLCRPLHFILALGSASHAFTRTWEEALLASSAHFLEKAPCIDPPVLSVIYAGAVNARRDAEVAVRSTVDGRDSL